LDDIINSINILAERALNSVEQGLLNAPPATLGFRKPATSSGNGGAPPKLAVEEQAKHEIENGSHQLETLLCASIDKNFDLFELYVMRNILCLRPVDRDWIRLAHYEGLDFTPPREGDPTVESVTALRRKLHASQRLNTMLHTEKARNDALLEKLRGALGRGGKLKAGSTKQEGGTSEEASPFGFLRNRGDLAGSDGHTPLTTTTDFTLSQLQSLRALSASLRNILPAINPSLDDADGSSSSRKNWRRERMEYVEGATRKHLEQVRGLELDKAGEVRDGEWQGEGRAFGKGEVEGLEKVVTLLGKGNDRDAMDES
jgi:kinetochore protein Mis12/MTW1